MAIKNGLRVYVVHENGQPLALVRAPSQAAAIQRAIGDRFEAVVADQDHLLALAGKVPLIEPSDPVAAIMPTAR